MNRLLAFLLALSLLLPFCAFAEEAEPSELDNAVDGKFRQFQSRCGEVVVAKDGVILYQRSFGFADQEKTVPATPDHYYRLASVSKLVTASAYMRLVETGQIDLDENIGEYLHLEGEKPFFAATSSESSGMAIRFSERMEISASCTSLAQREISSTRAIAPSSIAV